MNKALKFEMTSCLAEFTAENFYNSVLQSDDNSDDINQLVPLISHKNTKLQTKNHWKAEYIHNFHCIGQRETWFFPSLWYRNCGNLIFVKNSSGPDFLFVS